MFFFLVLRMHPRANLPARLNAHLLSLNALLVFVLLSTLLQIKEARSKETQSRFELLILIIIF